MSGRGRALIGLSLPQSMSMRAQRSVAVRLPRHVRLRGPPVGQWSVNDCRFAKKKRQKKNARRHRCPECAAHRIITANSSVRFGVARRTRKCDARSGADTINAVEHDLHVSISMRIPVEKLSLCIDIRCRRRVFNHHFISESEERRAGPECTPLNANERGSKIRRKVKPRSHSRAAEQFVAMLNRNQRIQHRR